MSNNQSGFIKIPFLTVILSATYGLLGCGEYTAKVYNQEPKYVSKQEILNGSEVLATSPVAKKVLYLATGAKLLKTSNGQSASQTGLCTATAIGPKIILTAAHCLKGLNPNQDQTADSVFIILGRKPWKAKFDPKLWYGAQKIFIHPNYKKNDIGGSVDDLAIIQLKTALPKENITELATPEDLNSTMVFIMAGYGMRSSLKNQSVELARQNMGELFQLSKIILNYEIDNLTIDIDQHDEKGICTGDSGGPGLIFNQSTQKYLIIGVVSGYQWTTEDKVKYDTDNKFDCYGFAVYTNIMNPNYFGWIQKIKESIE